MTVADSARTARRVDTGAAITTIVFDLGAVLIDWDPRHVYRELFADQADMETFLATICTPAWNAEQDRGRSLASGTAELLALYPDHAELIAAYYDRWHEMLGDLIDGTVDIVEELKAAGIRLLVLSNWSAETFPVARTRLTFLTGFDGIVISGEVGLAKPDRAIFDLLIARHDVEVRHAMFIDDSAANVATATELGFDAVVFTSPEQLREQLVKRNLLAPIDSAPARSVDEDE